MRIDYKDAAEAMAVAVASIGTIIGLTEGLSRLEKLYEDHRNKRRENKQAHKSVRKSQKRRKLFD